MAGQPDLRGQARTQIGEAGVTLRVPRGPYCPLPPGLGTCSSLGLGIPHHPVTISDSPLVTFKDLVPSRKPSCTPLCWVSCAFPVHLSHFISILKVPVLVDKY